MTNQLITEIDNLLPASPYVRPGGSLLIMVGLPGAGKSFVVQQLSRFLPFVVIATDRVRLYVRGQPTYTAAEMAYIYEVCYGLVGARLAAGQRVVFDGSNYLAARRQRLIAIAERYRSAVAICYVQAAESITRLRLSGRANGDKDSNDLSDAGWSVYQWMVAAQEPVAVSHLILDTTETPTELLAQRLYHYWIECESQFSQNYLQPLSWPNEFAHDA